MKSQKNRYLITLLLFILPMLSSSSIENAKEDYQMVVLVKTEKLTEKDVTILKTLNPDKLKACVSEQRYSFFEKDSIAYVYPQNLFKLGQMKFMTQGMIALNKAIGTGKHIFNLSNMEPTDANIIRDAIVASGCIDTRDQMLLSRTDFKFSVGGLTEVRITDGNTSITRDIVPKTEGIDSSGLTEEVLNVMPDEQTDPNPEITDRLKKIREDFNSNITTQLTYHFSKAKISEYDKAVSTTKFMNYLMDKLKVEKKQYDDIYATLLSSLKNAMGEANDPSMLVGSSLTDANNPLKKSLLQDIASLWKMDFDSKSSAESFSSRAKVSGITTFIAIQVAKSKYVAIRTMRLID